MNDKYIIHREKEGFETIGSSLKGLLYARYEDIVKAFGTPDQIVCDKVDWQWKLNIHGPDGLNTIVTIYNYKDGPNYGVVGRTPRSITCWHIGGFDCTGVFPIHEILGEFVEYNTTRPLSQQKGETRDCLVSAVTTEEVKAKLKDESIELGVSLSELIHNTLKERVTS